MQQLVEVVPRLVKVKFLLFFFFMFFQHYLGEALHLVNKVLKDWLGRSIYYGREICYTLYSNSFLIVYH